MKNPQVISVAGPSADTVLVVWGKNVIKDSGVEEQVPLAELSVPITSVVVDVVVFNVTNGSTVGTSASVTMTYESNSKFWKIPLAGGTPAISTLFTDHSKYVARVFEHAGGTADMREFSLDEFAVDNDLFELTLARLPYEVCINNRYPGQSWMVWYDSVTNFGNLTFAKYRARVYEGGIGTTDATDASRVTHRGPIISI